MINPIHRPFPFIQQTGMMECGTTSLAMIFKHYGFYNVQRVLAQISNIDTQGTNLYTLANVASYFGFKAEGYEMEFHSLQEIITPCIAHYEGAHFVVIYEVSNTHVWVADPAYGKSKISKAEFEKKWNGIILTLEPTEHIFKNKDMLDLVETEKKENLSLYQKFYKPTVRPRRKLL